MDWKNEDKKLVPAEVKVEGVNPYSIFGPTGKFDGRSGEPVFVLRLKNARGSEWVWYASFEEASKITKFVQANQEMVVDETRIRLVLRVEERPRQDGTTYETIVIENVAIAKK